MKSPHKCPPSIHFKPSVDLLEIVGYFTYKCKTDWAIESEMVIGYEIPSALAAWRARRRGPLLFSLHCHTSCQVISKSGCTECLSIQGF